MRISDPRLSTLPPFTKVAASIGESHLLTADDIDDVVAELRQLSQLGTAPPVPFSITLRMGDAKASSLIVNRVLRFLPGKRLVVRATLENRVVLAKLFFGAMAQRYVKRERDGIERIASAGVPTPALIGAGAVGSDGCALVFEYVERACELTQERLFAEDLLDDLVRVIARLHASGVQQTDIHLRNFLVGGESADTLLHTIDGGGVRALSDRPADALANLAWLVAQIDPHYLVEERVYRAYVAARGWQSDALERFVASVASARRVRLARYLKKTLRDCTQFSSRSVAGVAVMVERAHQSTALDEILADPDAAIARGEVLKAGNTATVARVSLGSTTVIVKRYNVKNLFHGMKLLARKSRARRTWQNGHRLIFQGVPTARPLALIEGRGGLSTYVVLEDLGGQDLAALAAKGLGQNVIDAVGDLFHRLARAEVFHGDTKATNFVVRDGTVYVIDLDALQSGGAEEHERDVVRFLENWRSDDKAFGDLEDRFSRALRTTVA